MTNTTLQRRIAEAQKLRQIEIGGEVFERIRYGHDYVNAKPTCRDCGVRAGMFHVPTCCVERCAKCRVGQAITCTCLDDCPLTEEDDAQLDEQGFSLAQVIRRGGTA